MTKLRKLDKGLALELQGGRALGMPWALLDHVIEKTKQQELGIVRGSPLEGYKII